MDYFLLQNSLEKQELVSSEASPSHPASQGLSSETKVSVRTFQHTDNPSFLLTSP